MVSDVILSLLQKYLRQSYDVELTALGLGTSASLFFFLVAYQYTHTHTHTSVYKLGFSFIF